MVAMPQMLGIGGGGFMTIREPKPGTEGFMYSTIDFRETAPAGAHRDMYKFNRGAAQIGGLASGVPGELKGLQYLKEKYGSDRLTWSQLVQPAIKKAEEGWEVSKDLEIYMNRAVGNGKDFLLEFPWNETFAKEGKRVKEGDLVKRKKYAETLQTIAMDGVEEFYKGKIGKSITKAVQSDDGIMTEYDLRNYVIVQREPLIDRYHDHTIVSPMAPSSGVIAQKVLKVLNLYGDLFKNLTNVHRDTHRMIEAMRFGYAMRRKLGDPAFNEGMEEFQEKMLSNEEINRVHGNITDDSTHEESYYGQGGDPGRERGGTSHMVTADNTGLAISLITSVNLFFGSHVMDPDTGIIMNDSMDDFSIPGEANAFGYIPSPENFICPGKRPQSSMSPVIVTGPDKFTFLAGSAGGSHITSATIQNIIHVVDEGLSAEEALRKPRLHDQLNPYICSFEHGHGFCHETDKYDMNTVAEMARLGHNASWIMPGMSTAQAIRWSNGGFEAAGEPRQCNSGGAVSCHSDF
ncbi:gamma-glutamyltranspeptidase 1 [Aspergillus udagawae]|uniref:Gamma-glutamyltranspeptidase 1 n=1 Tax=Aspergillus udagawae TaxID=91492 RepID=A0A8H3XRC0_9EURO|nr:gamma-glutamyltranspeptidase 1 [Aspergillus udagawae]